MNDPPQNRPFPGRSGKISEIAKNKKALFVILPNSARLSVSFEKLFEIIPVNGPLGLLRRRRVDWLAHLLPGLLLCLFQRGLQCF